MSDADHIRNYLREREINTPSGSPVTKNLWATLKSLVDNAGEIDPADAITALAEAIEDLEELIRSR